MCARRGAGRPAPVRSSRERRRRPRCSPFTCPRPHSLAAWPCRASTPGPVFSANDALLRGCRRLARSGVDGQTAGPAGGGGTFGEAPSPNTGVRGVRSLKWGGGGEPATVVGAEGERPRGPARPFRWLRGVLRRLFPGGPDSPLPRTASLHPVLSGHQEAGFSIALPSALQSGPVGTYSLLILSQEK